MTWISDFNLVKAVSEVGAFPVLAGGNMPPDLFEKEVDKCIANLTKPFAVNLITIAPNFRAHYEILKCRKHVVVFAGGIPRRSDIEGLRTRGKRVLSFAPEDSIARQQVEYGIDALILEGSEAGGHIGHVSLMILLQQVLFRIKDGSDIRGRWHCRRPDDCAFIVNGRDRCATGNSLRSDRRMPDTPGF
jgi:enoyl-[acyl-carrier protein] reductase II